MNTLTTLTPAETLFVLEERQAGLKPLMRVTLMDLLLKRVLKAIPAIPVQGSKQKPTLYFIRGDTFDTYHAQPHEEIFLFAYRDPRTTPLLFRYLIKLGLERINNLKSFQNMILKSQALTPCFSQNFLQSVAGLYRRTPQRDFLYQRINAEWKSVYDKLLTPATSNPATFREIARGIRGNIFLIADTSTGTMREIDTALADQEHESGDPWLDSEASTALFEFDLIFAGELATWRQNHGGGCSGGGSDAGDSGCSGCGGDSGCSGCGGCGGCGGD